MPPVKVPRMVPASLYNTTKEEKESILMKKGAVIFLILAIVCFPLAVILKLAKNYQ